MPRVQLPVVNPKRNASNKGRIISQKRPLLPKQVWPIRALLELAGYLRDLALFNVAIDSKLRGCDLVKLAVVDLVKDDHIRERVSVTQCKTKKPVQFELTENTRETVIALVRSPELLCCRFMFSSRFHDRPHISTRQYDRLVRDWVTSIGLEPTGYGTHSIRRTKAAEIYRPAWMHGTFINAACGMLTSILRKTQKMRIGSFLMPKPKTQALRRHMLALPMYLI
ncbi:tyrosine-type recombinase/integrase [Yoonia sediminilitoris]|uniref:tyrosine-type recombinase/integrase n=1 Tax=Yoonia sediminilitoris TaxID=1286148 RepID=UPI000D3CD12D|nr:tyrosine-type recombinase/integrase [Yoonia sediminilitoris]